MHVVFLFGSHIETQLVDNVKNMLDCGEFLKCEAYCLVPRFKCEAYCLVLRIIVYVQGPRLLTYDRSNI